MYTVRLDGSLEKKWNVEGWYSFGTYPSDDGVYLTRFGDWPTGDSPKKEDLAVAFYKQGKLIRTYSTADLIVDPKKVRVTVSHYQWLAEGQHGHFYYKQFGLTTIEGREIIFDLESGEITKVYEPNPENCSHAKP